MPRKKKIASKTTKAAKNSQTKAEFILALPTDMPAKEAVAKAEAAGFTLNQQRVHAIRWAAKHATKKARTGAKTVPAAKAVRVKAKPTKHVPASKPQPEAKPKTAKPITKAAYVLGFAAGTPAADIVAKGKGEGIKLSVAHVYAIRTAAKAKAKKGKAASATAKVARTKAKNAPGVVGRTSRDRDASPTGIAGIEPLDLAYAVGRLVAEGKTTAAEIIKLAAERTARILALKTELEALKGGQVPVAELAKPVKTPKPRRTVAKPAALPTSKKAKPKAAKKRGTVKTHSVARKFTMTPKALAARKLQGKYLGYLRQVPDGEKLRFKAIAKEQGVTAVVAELTKRLGKG